MNFNVRRWWQEHSLKLLAIRDTPEAIAGGVAIGLFFGFTPLFGLKTLSTIFVAWVTRSNIIAAVLAATAHDILLPFMPVIYRFEYDIGYWLLSHPHRLPPSLRELDLGAHSWPTWDKFFAVGRPLLLGSIVCAGPCAVLGYFLTKALVRRHHERKKRAKEEMTNDE